MRKKMLLRKKAVVTSLLVTFIMCSVSTAVPAVHGSNVTSMINSSGRMFSIQEDDFDIFSKLEFLDKDKYEKFFKQLISEKVYKTHLFTADSKSFSFATFLEKYESFNQDFGLPDESFDEWIDLFYNNQNNTEWFYIYMALYSNFLIFSFGLDFEDWYTLISILLSQYIAIIFSFFLIALVMTSNPEINFLYLIMMLPYIGYLTASFTTFNMLITYAISMTFYVIDSKTQNPILNANISALALDAEKFPDNYPLFFYAHPVENTVGFYSINYLIVPPGIYNITVTAPGYKTKFFQTSPIDPRMGWVSKIALEPVNYTNCSKEKLAELIPEENDDLLLSPMFQETPLVYHRYIKKYKTQEFLIEKMCSIPDSLTKRFLFSYRKILERQTKLERLEGDKESLHKIWPTIRNKQNTSVKGIQNVLKSFFHTELEYTNFQFIENLYEWLFKLGGGIAVFGALSVSPWVSIILKIIARVDITSSDRFVALIFSFAFPVTWFLLVKWCESYLTLGSVGMTFEVVNEKGKKIENATIEAKHIPTAEVFKAIELRPISGLYKIKLTTNQMIHPVPPGSYVYTVDATEQGYDIYTDEIVLSLGEKDWSKSIKLVDIGPPTISNVKAEPESQAVGGNVNITCEVTDNVEVDEVYLNITYPDFTFENLSITQNNTEFSYYCDKPYYLIGNYSYFIWASDISGNTNTSDKEKYYFNII